MSVSATRGDERRSGPATRSSFVAEPGRDGRDARRDRRGQVEPGQPASRASTTSPRGRVTIDGVDVRDIDEAALRGAIGVALQEAVLFSGTIRDNIRYGRPDASDDEVIAAAKMAQAHDFIAGFPDGYDTIVGQRGVNLSGGQKQRVAIARALLRRAGGADPRRQHQRGRRRDRGAHPGGAGRATRMRQTRFVVAQRISTVLDADKILVLDDGGIVAAGHARRAAANPARSTARSTNSQMEMERSVHGVTTSENDSARRPPRRRRRFGRMGRGPRPDERQGRARRRTRAARSLRLWGYLRRQRLALEPDRCMVAAHDRARTAGAVPAGRGDRPLHHSPATCPAWLRICLLMLGVYARNSLLTWLQSYVMAGAAQRTVRDIRNDLFGKLQTLPLRFFDQRAHGDLMSRLTNDVENINLVLSDSVTSSSRACSAWSASRR